MIETYTKVLLKNRVAILLVAALLTVLSAYALHRIGIAENIDQLMLQHDPNYSFLEKFLQDYAQDEVVVVAFETPDALSPSCLALLSRLEQAFQQMPGVLAVKSLASVEIMVPDGDELLVTTLTKQNEEGALPPALACRA